MDIYLDTCALNRLTDDLSQPRIRREADAVARILTLAFTGQLVWTASTALQHELLQNPNPVRRADALSLFANAHRVATPTPDTELRAKALERAGVGALDALHLAIAEQEKVDALLTTDDRFLKQSHSSGITSRLEVLNPVDWLNRRHPWLLPKAP